MIPTAIRRWTAFGRNRDLRMFGRIKIGSKETLIVYRWPHVIIRWSPLSVAIDRLLRRHKESK